MPCRIPAQLDSFRKVSQSFLELALQGVAHAPMMIGFPTSRIEPNRGIEVLHGLGVQISAGGRIALFQGFRRLLGIGFAALVQQPGL